MSIDSLSNIKIQDLFTIDGKDVWAVETYCELPTITLKNIRTGEKRGGAVGCLNLKDFVKLKPESEIGEKPEPTPFPDDGIKNKNDCELYQGDDKRCNSADNCLNENCDGKVVVLEPRLSCDSMDINKIKK